MTSNPQKLIADPLILEMWTKRDRCWMCKHRFDKPILLPVTTPSGGALNPNINVLASIHMMETHGMPTKDYVHNYVFNSIYGIKNTFENIYGNKRIFNFDTGGVLDD